MNRTIQLRKKQNELLQKAAWRSVLYDTAGSFFDIANLFQALLIMLKRMGL